MRRHHVHFVGQLQDGDSCCSGSVSRWNELHSLWTQVKKLLLRLLVTSLQNRWRARREFWMTMRGEFGWLAVSYCELLLLRWLTSGVTHPSGAAGQRTQPTPSLSE